MRLWDWFTFHDRGFPGKKYIRVSEIAQEGKKADLWIETGNNDLFGNLRTGTVKELSLIHI